MTQDRADALCTWGMLVVVSTMLLVGMYGLGVLGAIWWAGLPALLWLLVYLPPVRWLARWVFR